MEKPTFFDVVKSVLASFFGVQSEAKRKRDFQHGSPVQFILVGIGLTILFIVAVILLVRFILSTTV